MIVNVIDTEKEFFRLQDQWTALLKSSTADCVFLTHDWLSTWWKHLCERRDLSILTAREGDRLIGIMPLAARPPQYTRMMPRVLEFIGSGVIGSDYLDVIVEHDREDEVIQAFGGELNRRGLMIQLCQLRNGACIAARLPQILERTHWTTSEVKINVCPFIDLSNRTWESYLATLSSSQRYNFNRRLRTLQKTFDVRFSVISSIDEAERGLDTIITLHRKRWDSTGASEAFQTPAIVAFHQEFVQRAAEHGWLRLLILSLDNIPTAALYGLRYGPTFYFYQSGFDPAYSRHSVGLVMMGLAIKTAIEEGASEYDFLHGDEEYKFHWAPEYRDLGRIELYPPQAHARLYMHAIHLNRSARRMVRRVLEKA